MIRSCCSRQSAKHDAAPNWGQSPTTLNGLNAVEEWLSSVTGRMPEAIKWLRKATEGPFDALRPLSLAYQAMAEFRLGHTDEAKRLLHEADQLTSETKPAGEHWQNALYCRVAVEAAKSMILREPNRR